MSHSLTPDMQKLLSEAQDHVKHRRWAKASTIFEMVLQAEPDCVAAKAGRIMVKYQLSTIDAITECKQEMTTEEQDILTAAFADIGEDISSLMNHYRVTFHDDTLENSYKKAKKTAKACKFIPKHFTKINTTKERKCDFISDYDFESLNQSCLKIKRCRQEFQAFGAYKDSAQCAELCDLTYEMIAKANTFIPRTKWAKKHPMFKFFGLPCLLYALLSWILVFFGNFQLFTAPFQTVKRFFSAISSGNFSHPLNALIISFIVIIALLSVFLVFYLFSRIFIGLIFYGLWDGDGIFYIPQVIAILISPFVFFFLSPIVSIVFLVIIGLRIRKQRKLIKYFTACNAELIQRMEFLSKQCSMLNPKRILRELF
ncbi:MAG: hypothetical protein J6K29_04830 [Clostridia bacterium]|nr:hypothetical protein [Clostridia bacterium]MBP3666358.1 hypothetical protein [Clostridia bacterium]